MKPIVRLAMISAVSLLVGCASNGLPALTELPEVSYQQQQLSPRQFRLVIVSDNELRRHRALLLRAAELTRRLEYDWFVIRPLEEQQRQSKRQDQLTNHLILGIGVQPTSSCSFQPEAVLAAFSNHWNRPELFKNNCFT